MANRIFYIDYMRPSKSALATNGHVRKVPMKGKYTAATPTRARAMRPQSARCGRTVAGKASVGPSTIRADCRKDFTACRRRAERGAWARVAAMAVIFVFLMEVKMR